ncbi:PadR family transcriptional regulator [Compostimonas suwonensis]|uniref:PadR family transcriptional regulator PadR n=1 Tax=Compostimonas suwonensis TaxID=1048394 RepID=A0A2M9BBV4_9MICO|nr:PadR family transcriptional regulator [Compostimonas suwonensis]PJJ55426.1 PadR family transcriptional regulator PadR [Compostimonas suwonensis]
MSADWPGEWLRGVLETMVLSIVSERDSYGYLIASRLDEAGLGAVKGGTLYPLLNRLESDGALASEWRRGDGGPGRKFYALTGHGQQRLERQRAQWALFAELSSAVIDGRTRS